MPIKNINHTTEKKRWIIGVCILLVIVLLAFAVNHFLLTDKTINPSDNAKVIKTTSKSSTNSSSKATSTTPTTTSDKSSQNGGSPASASDPTVVIQSPTGAFVSNHSPNLSGAPAPSTEESVCNGTPGATCYVQFTNNDDGTVYKLPQQTLDTNGTTYWQWDIKDNLKQGTWHVVAFTTLGSQIKSASDARDLTVGP